MAKWSPIEMIKTRLTHQSKIILLPNGRFIRTSPEATSQHQYKCTTLREVNISGNTTSHKHMRSYPDWELASSDSASLWSDTKLTKSCELHAI